MELSGAMSSKMSSKNFLYFLKKIFLIFQETELSSFFFFFLSFSYISENKTFFKKTSYISRRKFPSLKNKKKSSETISYISGYGNFQFQAQETFISAWSLQTPKKQTKNIRFKEISYIFLKKVPPHFSIFSRTKNLLLYPLLLSYSFLAIGLLITHPIVDISQNFGYVLRVKRKENIWTSGNVILLQIILRTFEGLHLYKKKDSFKGVLL